ncbi:MAG: protoporphyrinogen oxidase [Thermodesulfobacteriota bacterium]
MNISIIGAGISGLSCAYHLDKLAKQSGKDIDINLFEKSNTPGGSISTLRDGGFIIEEGADSFITSKPWALDICREIGLGDKLISPNENNRRTFVYLDNTLNKLPEGFFLLAPSNLDTFSKSSFFSEYEKERILDEQSVPVREDVTDESIDNFVFRRFGSELLEKVAKPLIGGIYTGDTKMLSANAVLPEFVSMEKEYGSVIKGIQKKYTSSKISATESGARYGLFLSLENGISTLTDGLVDAMPDVNIHNNCELDSLSWRDGNWILKDIKGNEFISRGIILAVPPYVASKLISTVDTELSKELGKIEYASSLVAIMAVKKEDLANVPKCFGIVVPPSEKMNILACSFTSRKFPGRSIDGYEIVRCFAGGVLNPEIINKSESQISDLMLRELNLILNADLKPKFIMIKKYFNAMPQYNLGYLDLIKKINNKVSDLKTFTVAGNAYGGVGIPDCIKSGQNAAEYIFANLTSNLN